MGGDGGGGASAASAEPAQKRARREDDAFADAVLEACSVPRGEPMGVHGPACGWEVRKGGEPPLASFRVPAGQCVEFKCKEGEGARLRVLVVRGSAVKPPNKPWESEDEKGAPALAPAPARARRENAGRPAGGVHGKTFNTA